MRRSTSTIRRACAVGTTVALIGLTTGLGIMTATSASAATGDDTTTSAVTAPAATPADPTTPADGTTPDATSGDGAAPVATPGDDTPADGTTTTPSGTATGTPASPTDGSTGTGVKTPSGSTTKAADPGTPVTTQDADGTVAISGDAKVGVTLHAETTGFAGPHTYSWTRDDDTVVSTSESYKLTADDVDHVITVTVTDTTSEATAEASTAKVTEDVAFADADTNTVDTPLALSTDAGAAFTHTFGVSAGSGTVSYAIGYAFPDDSDSTDPDDQPSSYLPDGMEFNSTTGTLSGTSYSAGFYDFSIVASNGTSTATEYVEVTVNPGATIGIMAAATDTSSEDLFSGDKAANIWIIAPDGSILTLTYPADPDAEPTLTEGGQPTVKQGQSLWVQGSPVDQYGNDTTVYDPETGEPEQPVVTSDIASDQIAFDEDDFSTRVTFPHASTHHLTVAQDGSSVSFAVTVIPTVAPAVAVTPVNGGGQLAYTGTDATGALPWALGLLLVGAGLIGARTLRRRRAQG